MQDRTCTVDTVVYSQPRPSQACDRVHVDDDGLE